MWWFTNPDRLKAEDAAIDELRAREPWLSAATKRLAQDMRFAVDFDIVVNGETLPFTLEYPAHFPDAPPSVTPRDGRHYSGHQYGTGGELCLEYRADNWHPAITGAMMIASAYRLLAGEQPAPGQRAAVPSAHQSSLGQQLRGATCRFLLTRGLHDFVAGMPVGASLPCRMIEITGPNSTWTALVATIGAPGQPVWKEDTIPTRGEKGEDCVLFRIASVADVAITDQASLDAVTGVPLPVPANDFSLGRFTLLADGHSARLYMSLFKDGVWTLITYRTIDLSEERGARLPENYAALAAKKVGLVGCGSLGSKIATTLARSGVGAFVLVDDDIFKPGNLIRNELDAGSLGAHKADGLEARLKAVAPNVSITARRVLLGGQESSAGTASVLEALASCDLLIDASADPHGFNLVGAVARSALLPMIWAEVYAGGIGGFVARLRPNIEPPPHSARRQYLAWCEKNGVPWQAQDEDYGAQGGERAPLIADDADVGVISAHTARMALDTLIRPEASAFPHPAYVIGLSAEWIFTEPFDTRSVDFIQEDAWRGPVSEAQVTEAVNYLFSIVTPPDATRTGT